MEKVIQLKRGNAIFRNPLDLDGSFYTYQLSSSIDSRIMYVGMSKHPRKRLHRHLRESANKAKYQWINGLLSQGIRLVMEVVAAYSSKQEAMLAEIELIQKLKPSFNKSTTLNSQKECYVLDLKDNKIQHFKSQKDACDALGVWYGNFNAGINLKRYLMSNTNNFEEIIRDQATIKIKEPSGNIKYALTYPHASWILGCSEGAVNDAINGRLKTIKKCLITRVGCEFKDIPNYGRKVRCLNDGREFKLLKDAATYYNIDHSCITKVCKGTRKQIKGLRFQYV